MSRPPTPPALAARLLERVVPDGASGTSVLGDLHEEYVHLHGTRGPRAADLWYLAQALALGGPWLLRSMGRAATDGVGGLLLDLRASARALRRSPALVAVALLSLALGAGLTTTTAGLINAIWFDPLPYPEAHRLVDLEDAHPTEVCRGCSPGTSMRAFQEWRTNLGGVFDRVEALARRRGTLRSEGLPVDTEIGLLSPGMWELLGLGAGLGRLPAADEAGPESPDVVVLSHPFWTSRFGADPDVVGRVVHLDGRAHTVIGVLSESARPLTRGDVFRPLGAGDLPDDYRERGLWVLGRLAEGVELPAADAALRAFAGARFAADAELEPGWSAVAIPLRTTLTRSAAEPTAAGALLTLSVLVLLVASTNLAALLLARVTERGRELGVRSALGARRLRLARAGLMDAAILSALGGLGGLWVAWAVRAVALDRFGAELPPWIDFPLDARVLAATVGVVALATLVSGLLPLRAALAAATPARPGGADARTGGRGRLRVHDRLLGIQMVLGLVLVAGAAGAFRSFVRVADFDRLGFRWEGVTNVVVTQGAGSVHGLADRLAEAADAHPAIAAHTLTHSLFLGSWGTEAAASPLRLDGALEAVSDARVPRHSMAVGPRYFDLFEIPLVAGRPIGPEDHAGATPGAVVSVDAAEVLWPGVAPAAVLGRGFTVELAGVTRRWSVIGVAAAVMGNPSTESRRTTPRIYTRLAQTPAAHLAATPGAALTLRAVIPGAAPTRLEWARWLADVAPEASLSTTVAVEDTLREWIRPVWITGMSLAGLALLVLALLVLGIYGTVSYRISSLRRELGVRMALGAGHRAVLAAVLRRLATVVAVALAAGVALAALGDRFVSVGGIPIGNADPAILAGVATLMAAVAVGASVGPVLRALRIDPAGSLRAD